MLLCHRFESYTKCVKSYLKHHHPPPPPLLLLIKSSRDEDQPNICFVQSLYNQGQIGGRCPPSPCPSLPAVASTSRPRPSHYKVHAGLCEALGHGGAGGVGAPRAAHAAVGTVRMSGSHWAPYEDVGEGAAGAHGGQS